MGRAVSRLALDLPSHGHQCFRLFSWVLDVTEYGPDPSDPDAAEQGVKVVALEDARITVFYVPWSDPVVAVVEIFSWSERVTS